MSQRIVVTGTETVSDKIVNFQTNIEYPFSDVSVAFSPVQDLHGYDAPWPAGGGKNLSTASAEGSGTDVGVTFVYSGNTITASGTATGGNAEKTISIVPVVLKANTQYVLGFGHRGLIKNIRILGVAYNPYPKEYITLQFTEDTTVSDFVLRLNSSSGVAINDSWDWQLEQGSTPTAYIPYSNICPISGWTGLTVWRTGKNLCGESFKHGIFSVSNGVYYSHEGASTRYASVGILPIKGGQTYTLSWEDDPNNTAVTATAVFYKSGSLVGYEELNGAKTFTTPENADGVALNLLAATSITSISQISISKPQLELGSTATSYEPYAGTTYTIDLNGTRYGGTVDFVSGLMTLTKYFKSYSRVDGRSENEKGYFWYSTAGAIGIPVIAATSSGLLANRFKAVSNVHEGRPEGEMAFFANGIIRWKEQGSLSIADYRTYLASNPIEICYDLATPIEVQLTPTQVQTLIETNNVWSNANGDTTVTYSDGYYIDYISKIIYGDKIILDLTSDTITEPKLLTGYTAHRADGEYIEGSLPWRTVVQETLLYLDRASISQQTLNTDGSVTGTTLIL